MRRRRFLALLPPLLLAPGAVCLPPRPDFSGVWEQSNERCVPKRTGHVTRRIDIHSPDLVVETTILRNSGPPRHAMQRYRIDGGVTVSTGADGDEFHTSVVWKDQSLVFSIEEHEDGRVLPLSETWTLSANGSELQVQRNSAGGDADAARTQTIVYLRQPPETAGR